MTSRQQRRLQQKLARKAEKKAQRHQAQSIPEPAVEQAPSPACDSLVAPIQETAPISEAKLAANVANAQFSTGPVTEEGKAIVSQNATKHGLTGKFKVLPSESQSDFDKLLAGLLRSESPVGDDEIEMVHQMAEALWLSRRAVRLQNDCFAVLESGSPESAKGADARRQTGEAPLQHSGDALETAPVLRARSEEHRAAHKMMALYLRYQTAHDRTFFRFSTELRKRRNERARAERGFVSQKYKEAAERRRQEMHETRQALQKVKQEGQEIRNRLAAAKTKALELRIEAAKVRQQHRYEAEAAVAQAA